MTKEDGMAKLAYDEAVAAIARQSQHVDSLRRRALAIMGVTAALSAMIIRELDEFPPMDGREWILAAVFTGFALLPGGLILAPQWLKEDAKIDKMLEDRFRGISSADAHRKLAKSGAKAWRKNQKTEHKLLSLFQWQLVMSLASVVGWLLISM